MMKPFKALFKSPEGEYYEGRFAALEDVYEYANVHQYEVMAVKNMDKQ